MRIITRLTDYLRYLLVTLRIGILYFFKRSDPVMDKDEMFTKIYSQCKKYTMTSKERMYALYISTIHVIKSKIPGDFVECGVWRGGSTMLIALILKEFNNTSRKIYLYDTFEGMTVPSEKDFRTGTKGIRAVDRWKIKQKKNHNKWCYASLSDVKSNMNITDYPDDNLVYIKGRVEDTIPGLMPTRIALLRLDTDWYESTKHELMHLYPLMVKNGILILDDYGCWDGAKKAVDEYFENDPILLNRIDYTGRVGIKLS